MVGVKREELEQDDQAEQSLARATKEPPRRGRGRPRKDQAEQSPARATKRSRRGGRDRPGRDNGRQTKNTEEEEKDEEEVTLETLVLEKLPSDNEEVLVESLRKIYTCYLYDDQGKKNVREFKDLGGHNALVRAMNEHKGSREVQLNAMGVLIGASAYSVSVSIRTCIGKVKGIQAIFAAMQQFPEDEELFQDGLRALMNLCDDNFQNAECLVAKLVALPFLIAQSKKLVELADRWVGKLLADSASGLLVNLSNFDQLHRLIIEAKGLSFLSNALEKHPDDLLIQKYTRQAISKLAKPIEDSDDNESDNL